MAFYQRNLVLPKDKHFFLFGARNTGKSTLIEGSFSSKSTLFINLLKRKNMLRFSADPDLLYDTVIDLPENITHVVIDEIQKIPHLLDTVHELIKETDKKFVLTGSNARKLKRGGANLLAGRAFVYDLFPLSFTELGEDFNLNEALCYGTLPEVLQYDKPRDKQSFLNSYAHTYLKEEVWDEQEIRVLEPFRKFLDVAAQCNANIINHSKIAQDVGVDDKTVKNYFSILEDSLIGFYLEAYHPSTRKQMRKKPKFYFFDTGVVRSLTRTTLVPLEPRTRLYGEAFEHFVILECIRLAKYYKPDYRFYYLQDKNGAEIDLIVDRPGEKLLCIEIKSTENIMEKNLSSFVRLSNMLEDAEAVCFSRDEFPRKLEHTTLLPWEQGIRDYFMAI